MNLQVTIAKREDSKIRARRFKDQPEDELGIQVEDITPEIASRLNLAETNGAIISMVKPDGKGAEAGLMRGDIIKEVNHADIKSAEDYRIAVEKVGKGEIIQMFIKRANVGFLVIKITK
jgi:serine protease Do